jgi:serine/threonine-protein kinase
VANESGKQVSGQPQMPQRPSAGSSSDPTVFIRTSPQARPKQTSDNPAEPALPSQLFEKGSKLEGQTIAGRFLIESRIANGATGEVFRARDIDVERPLALKLITPAFTRDPEFLGAINQEIRVLSTINHPSIVTYFATGYDEAQGDHWIAMEYVEGLQLSEAIASRRFDGSDLMRLLKAVTEALHVIHGCGIIHRDIAPANIILRRGDPSQPVLIDFGIARLRHASEARMTIIAKGFEGTLAYAAPETFGMYGGRIGPWTDIYGLGAVIYEAALGRRAFDQTNFVEAIEARRTLPDLNGLSPELEKILRRMLEPDPEKRSGDVNHLMNDFWTIAHPTPGSMDAGWGSPAPDSIGAGWGAPLPEMPATSRARPSFLDRLSDWLSIGGPHGPGGGEDD